ncbi:MAG: hypothetical protein R3C39_06495 [Dehalococcoidia bacterium]
MNPDETCTLGGGLLRRACGRPALSACVYCGEPFCADHGERGPDYADVCARRECVAKQRDVEAHVEWKSRMQPLNDVSVCAEGECTERMRHQCSRCRLMFCAEHVKEVDVIDSTTRPPQRSRALVCPHCAARQSIWS